MKKTIISILLLAASKAAPNCIDLYVDALYLYTTEVIDWASVLVPKENSETVFFKTVSFNWDPGFRVGIGYTPSCSFWDMQLSYTYFQTKVTDRTEGDMIQSAYLGRRVSDIGFFQKGKIKTKINYNMFDLELGRTFCPSECFMLRPMIGLKGGWIDQRFKTSWEKTLEIFNILIPITAKENLRNDFWGIGPQGGVNSKWFFTNCFSLVGDFSAAFMWGDWTITDRYDDTFGSRINIKVPNRDIGAFVLQGFIGLGFDTRLFSFKVGYEVQDWFNQYQVFDNATGGQSGDLILQGLKIQARYNF